MGPPFKECESRFWASPKMAATPPLIVGVPRDASQGFGSPHAPARPEHGSRGNVTNCGKFKMTEKAFGTGLLKQLAYGYDRPHLMMHCADFSEHLWDFRMNDFDMQILELVQTDCRRNETAIKLYQQQLCSVRDPYYAGNFIGPKKLSRMGERGLKRKMQQKKHFPCHG